MFFNRVSSYGTNGTKQTGFIPDIVSLFGKYHLLDVSETYIKESVFPSKLIWKKIIKHRIHEHELYLWHSRTLQPEFSRFKRVHNNFRTHYVWIISRDKPKLLPACKSVIQMISNVVSVAEKWPIMLQM